MPSVRFYNKGLPVKYSITTSAPIIIFEIKGLFGNVVTVAMQNVFRLEMYSKNIFHFKKNICNIIISKQFENIKQLAKKQKI